MKIRLSLSAASDLDSIIEYLEERNPLAASETVEAIFDAIDLLLQFPDMGRLGEEPGTRELVIESTFVVPYRVREEVIEIIRIWHGAKDRSR